MKINEVTNTPHSYIATVRVVLRDGATTARTTVTADNLQHARLILTRIFGDGNISGISQATNESPKTSNIQAQASNGGRAVHSKRTKTKNDPVHVSCVAEAGASTRVLTPSELQVKSLSDRAKQLNQQAKQMRARQSLAKAQEQLVQARQST